MEKSNKKPEILVTGGAGFIGSNTVKLLINLGYDVTVFDNLSMGYRDFVDPQARFIKGDLLDKKAITNALEGKTHVFHFAAVSIIKHSIEDPVNCFNTNINGLLNLLEGMRIQKVKHLVNSSSAAVYGEPETIPITEDSKKEPVTPYGASKLATEATLSSYFHSYGINSTSLRYFNAYGPYDEQLPVTRAVPIWIKAVLQNKPIPLYWKGKQFRDYVFVGDIAKAHVAVMNLKGFNYFNIGTGTGILMRDLVDVIFKHLGKKTKIIDAGERPGDPNRLTADISKIKKAVGWAPEYSLEEGMKITIDYYKKNQR